MDRTDGMDLLWDGCAVNGCVMGWMRHGMDVLWDGCAMEWMCYGWMCHGMDGPVCNRMVELRLQPGSPRAKYTE